MSIRPVPGPQGLALSSLCLPFSPEVEVVRHWTLSRDVPVFTSAQTMLLRVRASTEGQSVVEPGSILSLLFSDESSNSLKWQRQTESMCSGQEGVICDLSVGTRESRDEYLTVSCCVSC